MKMRIPLLALAIAATFISCGASAHDNGNTGGNVSQNVTVITNVISVNTNQPQVNANTAGLKQEVIDRKAGDANLQGQLNGAVAAGAAAYGQVQGQIGSVNNDLQASKNYQLQVNAGQAEVNAGQSAVNAGQSQVNAAQSGVNHQVQGQISQTNTNLANAVSYQSGVNQAQAGTNQHVQQQVATINDVNASQQTQINTSTSANTRQDVTIGQHSAAITQQADRQQAFEDYSRDMDSRLGGRLDSLQSETRHALKVGKQAQEMAVGAAAIAMQQFCTGLECGFQSAVSVANSGGVSALAVGFGGAVSQNWFVNGAISKAGNTTTAGMSVTTRW